MIKRNAFLTFVFMALIASAADAATVTARSASRSSAARAPTMAAKVNKSDTTTTATNSTTTPIVVQSVATPATTNNTYVAETVDFGPIENKTTFFDTILDNASLTNTDTAASNLASLVRAQRAALDASSNATTTAVSTAKVNACDVGLRSCMTDKCGKNFAKCSSDNDTIFGTKLDACRRNLTCTANEFKLLSAEIKSDRAQAIKLKAFNDILDCGNEYDQCILNQCGTTYAKCLGRRDGDTAISKCSSIANRCAAMDNGLPNRAMSVFATLRQNAEKQIVSDENQLYTMRDNMRSICQRIGAMFDDRSLDCVYTVNFYAGEDSTLYASKKLYAGSTFDCTPNWFGVDVTTFMDNAYRLTRSQTSASSAMLGSGLGMAVGSLTSDAIDRAIDTKKADNALERAKCEQEGKGKWNAILGQCVTDKQTEKAQKQQDRQQERINNRATGNTAINKVGNAVKNVTTKAAAGVKNATGAVGTAFSNTANNIQDFFTPSGDPKAKQQDGDKQSGDESGGEGSAVAPGTAGTPAPVTAQPAIDESGDGEGGEASVGGDEVPNQLSDVGTQKVTYPYFDSVYDITGSTQQEWLNNAIYYLASHYCTEPDNVDLDLMQTALFYSGSNVPCSGSTPSNANPEQLKQDKNLIYNYDQYIKLNSDDMYQIPDPSTNTVFNKTEKTHHPQQEQSTAKYVNANNTKRSQRPITVKV